MSDVAIIAEGLGKKYRLGTGAHHYGRLTQSLSEAFSAPLRKLRRRAPTVRDTYFWAVKDVSLEVERGSAIGIIGRNGAGKTTLLKMLSRITEPTEGRARLHGTVGSLLEVGTGFHPELTGRENILLNGAILGMSKAQILKRFDEIVAFAEVEQFMETPVKRYSSGMQVRLAFAVAAHLEPEILIVDEVLAVGDAAFQRKCLGAMGDVASGGRTVLFVSHNMSVVSRLCDQGLWLDQGHVAAQGPMEEVVRQYLSASGGERAEFRAEDLDSAPGNDLVKLRAVRVRDHTGDVVSSVDAQHSTFLEIEHVVLRAAPLRTAFKLSNAEGIVLFTSTDADDEGRAGRTREPGIYVSRCEIPSRLLKRGLYFLSISSSIPMVKVNFSLDNVLSFSVDQTDALLEDRVGVIAPALHWEIERISGDIPSGSTLSADR